MLNKQMTVATEMPEKASTHPFGAQKSGDDGASCSEQHRCRLHKNLSCSTPMMRQIEAISRYALDTLGVRPDYISNLKRFKATVHPKTLCYTAYTQMLDRLVEYAQRLERLGGAVQNSPEHNDSRQDGEK
jgi:hypothetical protein